MTITAEIIKDSISPAGIRITTMQLRYPRFIHAEFMTHRMFSRNASSSRAIPVARMIEDLRRDPAMPVYWGSNKPGMQAGEELHGQGLENVKGIWLDAMEEMIFRAEILMEMGLHKQIANRILEPWAHINVVVTATDYKNFFMLRQHKDAQPEIKFLADMMRGAMMVSTPELLQPGQWHLPYIGSSDIEDACAGEESDCYIETLKKVSVARCARVSYLTHDGRQTTVEEDLQLYDRLLGAQPLHASPAEHQATPDTWEDYLDGTPRFDWVKPQLHGNFRGWIQLRKTLPGEFIAG